MINFISGLIIGGLIGIAIMCLLQINRDNKAQRRINKAIKYIKKNNYLGLYWRLDLLNILGGDVDDE